MLRNLIVYFIFLLLALIVQGQIVPELSSRFVVPDLFLIAVIAAALKFQKTSALIVSFICGLLADFSSGVVVGPQAAGCVLACVFTQTFSKNIFVERFLSVAIISACAVFLKEIVSNGLIIIFSPTEYFSGRFTYLLSNLPVEIIVTAILTPIFLKILLKRALTNV